MFDIFLESLRAMVMVALFLFLSFMGRRENIRSTPGWGCLRAGVLLLLFGSLIDITDNFESLNRYVVVGDTEAQAFLEKVVGFLLGFFFLSIGFWKWLPSVVLLQKTQRQLNDAHVLLEEQVHERTAELQEANEELAQANENLLEEIGERGRVEEDLNRTTELLQGIFNNLPEAVFSVDMVDYHVMLMSPACGEIYGYPPEAFYEKPMLWREVVHPDDLHVIEETEPDLLKGRPVRQAYRIFRKDGTTAYVDSTIIPEIGEDRKVVRANGIVTDITESKRAEESLRESEERFRRVFEDGPLGMATFSVEGRITDANPIFCGMFDYGLEEIKEKTFLDLTVPERRELDWENVRKMIAGEFPYIKAEKRYIHKDGSEFWGSVTATVVRDEQGRYLYTLAMLEDITERRQAEESLRLMDKAVRTSTVGFTFRDSGNIIRFMNPAEERMHGYQTGELIGKEVSALATPGTSNPLTIEQMRTLKGWARESMNRRKDGSLFPVYLISDVVRDENGEPLGVITACEDITERKKAEEQILKALKEKEVLLSEVHHRVKNNLAIVSSLLQLQARQVEDDQARKSLKDSQARIKSLSLVHEKLYLAGNFAELNVEEYVKALLHAIFRSYKQEGKSINLSLDVEDVSLTMNKLIPLGLILNELVTNSLKYAFDGIDQGEVGVSLKRNPLGLLSLIVCDNGPGLSDEVEIERSESLGLRMISTLVRQLAGELDYRAEGGACFEIRFSPEEEENI